MKLFSALYFLFLLTPFSFVRGCYSIGDNFLLLINCSVARFSMKKCLFLCKSSFLLFTYLLLAQLSNRERRLSHTSHFLFFICFSLTSFSVKKVCFFVKALPLHTFPWRNSVSPQELISAPYLLTFSIERGLSPLGNHFPFPFCIKNNLPFHVRSFLSLFAFLASFSIERS